MPTEQELTLIAKAKDFDKAAGEVAKVTAEERKMAEAILQSSKASKEGAAAARATIEQYTAQQEAARKATPAVEALKQAQERLAKAQANLGRARTSGSVGEVEKYRDEVKAASEEVEKFAGANQGLAASEEDLLGVLQKVHPAIAEVGDVGLKLVRVLDQVGKGNVSVGDAISAVNKALRNNLGLLKTAAASAAVVAGIAAIVSQYRALKEEAERATKAIEDNAQAATKAAREGRARESEIGRISISNKEGPLTPEQVRVLSDQVGRVRQKFPGVSEGLLNESAARLGPDVTDDQLVNTALLLEANKIQLPGEATAEQRRDIAFGGADRFADLVQRSRKVTGVEGVRARLAREAATQLRSSGGSRESVIEVLQAQGGKEFEGGDLDRIARAAQVFESGTPLTPESEAKAKVIAALRTAQGFGQSIPGHISSVLSTPTLEAPKLGPGGPTYGELLEDERQKALLSQEGIEGADVQLVAQGRRAAQLVGNERRRADQHFGPEGPTVINNYITNNNQNQRNIMPGRTGARPVKNGDSRVSTVQQGIRPRTAGF